MKQKTEWVQLNRQIRAAEKELGMSHEDHQALVQAVTGEDSLKGQPVAKLALVARELDARKASGFKKSHKPYVRKIWAMWGALVKAEQVQAEDKRAALAAYVSNRIKREIQNPAQLDWLTKSEGNKIIEALKAWSEKAGLPQYG